MENVSVTISVYYPLIIKGDINKLTNRALMQQLMHISAFKPDNYKARQVQVYAWNLKSTCIKHL